MRIFLLALASSAIYGESRQKRDTIYGNVSKLENLLSVLTVFGPLSYFLALAGLTGWLWTISRLDEAR